VTDVIAVLTRMRGAPVAAMQIEQRAPGEGEARRR
jgi:hypothetical protein